MGRPTKQFKRFAASGKLTETIKNRRSQREKKKKFEDKVDQRKKQRGAARPEHEVSGSEGEDEDEDIPDSMTTASGGKVGGVARTVDELFGAGGLDVPIEEGSDLEELSEGDEDDDEDDEDDEMDGDEDEDMDEEAMARAMAELEKKDPEFFKHLKAEDPSLLKFGKGGDSDEEDEEDEDMDEDEDEDMDEDGEEAAPKKIVVTLKMLRGWREGMLKVGRSSPISLTHAAALVPLAPQDAHCVPRRCAHE